MDALTGTYALSCPHAGTARVRLSAFRVVERLPGAAHPAVYRVLFACGCGDEHAALVSHDELDWAPLGLERGRTFVNLMTSSRQDLSVELADLMLMRLQAGQWPWSFFCYPEARCRPVTPSAFMLLAPGGDTREDSIGVAVRCPSCGAASVNVVTHAHVDLPFWNDAEVGVVAHVFPDDAAHTIEAFRVELQSATFDRKRLELE